MPRNANLDPQAPANTVQPMDTKRPRSAIGLFVIIYFLLAFLALATGCVRWALQ